MEKIESQLFHKIFFFFSKGLFPCLINFYCSENSSQNLNLCLGIWGLNIHTKKVDNSNQWKKD